jgi:hypothetical protein
MNRNLRLIFFLFLLILAGVVIAQSTDEQLNEIEKYIENSEQFNDQLDLDNPVHPSISYKVNLNTHEPIKLLSLLILTPTEVKAILKHHEEFGPFISVLELQTIEALSLPTILLLAKYVFIDENDLYEKKVKYQIKQANKELTGNMYTRWPLSEGYKVQENDSVSVFHGKPYQSQLRFKAKYKKDLYYGIQVENDAGEDFLRGSNPYGFDFYSSHVFLHRKGWIKKVAVGDYQAAFGQGLTFASGFGIGKSANVLNIKKFSEGLKPYRSMQENEFLRGLGLTYGNDKFEFTTVISRVSQDVNLKSKKIMNDSVEVITSFINTGLHRTDLEISKEKNALRNLLAQNINFQYFNLNVGLTGQWTQFSHQILPEDQIYNKPYLKDNQFIKTGIHFDYYLRNANIFGEYSRGSNHSNGLIIGSHLSLGKYLDLACSYRKYSKNFIWYNCAGFSENSNPTNETGAYLGINLKISKKLILSSYLDTYESDWFTYQSDGISKGIDLLTELNFKPNASSVFYIRYKSKQELINSTRLNFNELNWNERSSLRFHTEVKLSTNLYLKSRFEWCEIITPVKEVQNGNLIFLDLTFKKKWSPFSIACRMTFFNCSDYLSRIYSTENNVLYSYAVIAYQNSGHKMYILAKYKYRQFQFHFRYAITNYYDTNIIGSAYNTVNANKLNEINAMLSYSIN